MDSLKMHSKDITEENIEKIAALFPNCITEALDEQGRLRKKIDFDLLRQELSREIVEGPQERYRLDWPGKRQALITANAPIAKTLRPCRVESVDFDKTKNLFIEGDNLDALKLLQETYLGKVKMIYIDPPYNTGNDFVYSDNFYDSVNSYLINSGQMDFEGKKQVTNLESNGRFHSIWLSMMYSRLKLARNFLKDDGVIFISIDNNEVNNLQKICSEIFGEDNFVSLLIWRNGGTSASQFTEEHEYILCFAKNKKKLGFFKYSGSSVISDRSIKKPSVKNPVSSIRFPVGIDFECEDKIFPNYFGENEPVKIISGIFESKNKKLANEVEIEAAWTMKEMILKWLNGEEVFDQKGQKLNRFYFKSNGVLQYEKIKGTTHPKSVIEGFSTKQGSNQLIDLLGKNYFNFPKPVNLISFLIELVTSDSDIVLDFFAGSSTTAHAVISSNINDNSRRKFIMIQLSEPCNTNLEAYNDGFNTIADISKERIRQAGKKIKAGYPNSTDIEKFDFGFRVLKIDSSNMADVYYTTNTITQDLLTRHTDNLKSDRTPEDILFQILLDWGVDLTLPITKKIIHDHEVFFVDENTLVACFDTDGKITEEFVKELTQYNPLRAVFRDAGFATDSVKINVTQIFKQLSPHTEVKTI
ncbi:site-specific DNA-methyltransferase [Legionella pneumophila serogroup 1]